MSNFEKSVIAFLSVLALGMVGAAIWLYQTRWQQPLGPALQIVNVTPFGLPPTWTPNPNMTSTPLSHPVIDPALQTVTPAAYPPGTAGYCNLPAVTTLLAIGSDTRSETYTYGLADVIRLIRIDSVIPKISVLEIPRDLWVEIPDIADNLNGQDHEKLNQAYLYGNPGFAYTNDPAHGPGLLARTLALNFGTQIDHYAAVNMKTFVKIVDAVGGVDVTLLDTVDGRTPTDTNTRLYFPKGEHHLNGTEALTLARIRIEGTFARADNQNIVLCALRKKLVNPSVITSVPDLVRSFQGAVQTDLSPEQLGQLACLGTHLQPNNITFTSFPTNLFSQDRMYDPVFKKSVFVWNANYDTLRAYVTLFNQGTWPNAITVADPQHQQGDSQICQ